ncbi:cysteine--tRNA ligase [Candidatus Woesearchaeota archaeon CG10_big_fil_rev_8_21_14_0_10_45_16]|nr:MAG: cysteine--tRNA ligase [Candidatus Woesearchaeota archaeon CG10_big_fil_rev_8_21_14_0_10_45_16]
MPLVLSNTLSKKREKFIPLGKAVGLYTCGPTVYNYAHIGNLRAYVFTDILKRVLILDGYKVKHVMNITDVGHLTSDADQGEDKMTKGLQREGLPLTLEGMGKLAEKYTQAFKDDLDKLQILIPDFMPKASEHIKEDIELIGSLEKKKFTYKTSDGVYFDTSRLPDYGKLLGSDQQSDEEHARLKGKTEKKNPEDFALWKFNDSLGWEAPWGKGFPGWHIECSAMASKYLGKQFDIHCGGREHIAIHHTNEIAQSEAAFSKKPWVKYWLHNEWLVLGAGKKMAKSGDNFITLTALEKKGYDPLDFRYLCLGTHYKKPLMFTFEALEGAQKARRKLVDKVLELKDSESKESKTRQKKYLDAFGKDLDDDLNTPKALATMWEMLKDKTLSGKDKYSLLLKFDDVLGLDLNGAEKADVPKEVISLAEERQRAREKKDWKKSDELREKIAKLGYTVGDTKEGYEISQS